MDLKSLVGQKAGPFEEPITAEMVRRFSVAVGAREMPGGEIPPTFPTLFRRGEFELFQKLNIPLAKVLHGEQEYVTESPVHAGETVSYDTRLANVLEKRGSTPMQILVFETEYRVGERRAGISRTTVILRGGS